MSTQPRHPQGRERPAPFIEPPPEAGPVVAGNGKDDGEAKPASRTDDERIVRILSGDPEWPVRIKLKKPIHDKSANPVDVIELREPTVADIMAIGDPAIYGDDGMTMDAARLSQLIARLSATPVPFIQQMSVSDYQLIRMVLSRFFAPRLTGLASSSTATD